MPYKRNPMRSERCCGFARFMMSLPMNTLATEAVQGFERTLDDSANRRLVIPDAFLTADAMLTTLQNIFEGIVVQESEIRKNIDITLPFLILETVLMELTLEGQSRQDAHEKIRDVAMKAHEIRKQGERVNVLAIIEQLGYAQYFEPVMQNIKSMLDDKDHRNLIGLCPDQVDEFLTAELLPALEPYRSVMETGMAVLNV